MENPATGDARISGTCASLCGLERALDSGDGKAIEFALRRIELLHALIASLVGIPLIYSGDEIASLNDYSYEEVPEFAADNRWMHRPRMDWEVAARAARGEGHEGRILSFVRSCLRLRRSLPALAQDAPFEVLHSEEGLLAVLRSPPDRASAPLLVLANFTEEDRYYEPDRRRLDPAGEGFVDLLDEGASFGGDPIPISALRVRWLARP
jgi:amylosucrase